MRIAVFGGTGGIGSLVVDRLLTRGDEVVALVRSPEGIDAERPGLTVLVGELADTDLVMQAVGGVDGVISALGPDVDRPRASPDTPGHDMPVAEGTGRIVEAMREAGVRRYVGLATPSVADPRDRPTLRGWLIPRMAALVVPRAVAEVRAMSAIVRASGLDWTLVRITMLVDGPASGRARPGYLGRDLLGPRVRRADVADFLVAQLRDRAHIGASPAIGT